MPFSYLCRKFLLLAISLILLSSYAQSQGLGGGMGGSDRIEGKYKFLPIPYLNYDRALGVSVGAIPMLMFNPVDKDTISPSSIIGAGGIYTSNKTWFLMSFGKFFLKEDTWRLTGAVGVGTVNYQFYLDNPINGWIPYQTELVFATVKAERKIINKLYGGASYSYTKFISSTDSLPINDTTTLHGLGLNLSLDKRGSYYYPRSGYFISTEYSTTPAWLGNKNNSNQFEIEYNHFYPARKADVIASRVYAGIGIGSLSFNEQFIVGNTDIRGYTQGAYRGNYLIALQAEYRWNFHARMGLVGFLGFATVFEAINEKDNGKILPGIGTGFRYIVQPDTHFSIGMDIAAGIGDWGINFRIGEAF